MLTDGNRFWIALGIIGFIGLFGLMFMGPCGLKQAAPATAAPSAPAGWSPRYEPGQIHDMSPGSTRPPPIGRRTGDGTGGLDSVVVYDDTSKVTVNGAVYTPGGDPVPGQAVVLVYPGASTPPPQAMTRPDGGFMFLIDRPRIATYKVEAMVLRPPEGYTPGAAAVDVQRSQDYVTITVTLDAAASMTVTVRDEFNTQLHGVTVAWTRDPDPRLPREPRGVGRNGTGRSDSAGQARFSNLKFGLFKITVSTRGRQDIPFQYAEAYLRVDEAMEYAVEVKLPTRHTVTLQVILPSGERLVGTPVSCAFVHQPLGVQAPRPQRQTDDQGELLLEGVAEGAYALRVAVRGHPPKAVRFSVPQDQVVAVRLDFPATLEIEVFDNSTREPITQFMASIKPVDLYAGATRTRESQTTDLAPGPTAVTVQANNYITATESVVLVAGSTQRATIYLDRESENVLEVEVVDKANAPKQGVAVYLHRKIGDLAATPDSGFDLSSSVGGGAGRNATGTAITQDDGVARFANVEPGDYAITASDGHGAQGMLIGITVVEGQTPERQRLTLAGDGGEVTVVVTHGGQAVDYAEVFLRGAGDWFLQVSRTQASGATFKRSPVPPGVWDVLVAMPEVGLAADAPAADTITVRENRPAEIEIDIPSGALSGTVSITGLQEIQTGQLSWFLTARPPTGSRPGGPHLRVGRTVQVTSDGRFLVGGLPQGNYLVELYSGGLLYRATVNVGDGGDLGAVRFTEMPDDYVRETMGPRVRFH